MQEIVPTGEQPAANTSRSALSHRPVNRSVSVTTISSRETLASGTLWIVIPTSGTDSSEEKNGCARFTLTAPWSPGLVQ